MTTPNSSTNSQQALDVLKISRQALAIARIVDRLNAGAYTIHLNRTGTTSERWTVEVTTQAVTAVIVRKMEVFDKTQEERKE